MKKGGGASSPRVLREGLLEEVTFLQSPDIVSQAKQTAWWGVEAGVLEAQRTGSPRLWGAESSGGSQQGPGTSEAHISHPGEALQVAGAVGSSSAGPSRDPRCAQEMGPARPLAAALGTAAQILGLASLYIRAPERSPTNQSYCCPLDQRSPILRPHGPPVIGRPPVGDRCV